MIVHQERRYPEAFEPDLLGLLVMIAELTDEESAHLIVALHPWPESIDRRDADGTINILELFYHKTVDFITALDRSTEHVDSHTAHSRARILKLPRTSLSTSRSLPISAPSE